MSIADELTYLNETKRQLREAINTVFDAGLTESDSFRSYADFLYDLWTPELLFQTGEQGAWYDPSDLSTLFQDAAGTTPVTTDGDPVGLMLDKSGNGNHAAQRTSAGRPIYRTDGALHWLEFDGADDHLMLSKLDMLNGALGVTGVVGVKYNEVRITSFIFRADTEGSIGTSRFHLEAGRAKGKLSTNMRHTRSNPINNLNSATSYTGGVTVVQSGVFDVQAGIGELRVDGSTENYSENYLPSGQISTQDSRRILIGGASGQYISGRMYTLVIIAAALPPSSIKTVERYSALKTGVTL